MGGGNLLFLGQGRLLTIRTKLDSLDSHHTRCSHHNRRCRGSLFGSLCPQKIKRSADALYAELVVAGQLASLSDGGVPDFTNQTNLGSNCSEDVLVKGVEVELDVGGASALLWIGVHLDGGPDVEVDYHPGGVDVDAWKRKTSFDQVCHV